jgi:RNA polymerase sigma-70 factor (ECF subfamily)
MTQSTPTPAPFPAGTAWTNILGAADRSSQEWKARLDLLVQRYWKPICWYIRRRWNCSPEDAADLTQEFFSQLTEENFLSQASPERGRFRTFLKLKLRDLVLQELRRRSAEKRGGRVGIVSIDRAGAESVLELGAPGRSPEEEFDKVWATAQLSTAMDELKADLAGRDRAAVFDAFWNCAVATPPLTYRQCAEKLGVTPQDVANYVFNARGQLRTILLRQIRESVDGEQEAEQEFHYMLGLLGS